MAILVDASLILLMIIPREPLSVPYVLFIYSERSFYLVLSSRYYARLSSFDGRPVMKAMSSTLMDTGSSNHKNPLWRTPINCLMYLFTSFRLPKWGISTKFKIPVFVRTVAHCFGYNIGSPNGPVPRLSMYTCCANSRNLLVSDTLWSEYLILSMHPSIFGMAYTPSGMQGSKIEVSGCFHWDHTMGCFSFLLTSAIEVPASGSLSSPPESGYLVMSSNCPSSCYTDPTIGCGLGPSDFVGLLLPPFVLWDASVLAGCCWLPVATGSSSYALSCESISIPVIIEACYSSYTSVALTSSTCGEGTMLTSTIPSLCVVSCSAFVVSCNDWRLLVGP
jgi:hypothetical protein